MVPAKEAKQSYSDLFVIFILVLLVFWFAREMVFSDKIPFFRDLNTYFYPLRFSLAKALKAGQLPLWDRHIAMGFPVLADFQSGVFYPPHLFFLALPLFQAIRALFIFHYLVAIIGAYLLCRWWNYSRPHAMIGAILFTLGGTTISLTNLLNHFQSAVWLPVVVLLWERFLRQRSCWNFVFLALSLLTQFLAGSPEIYAMTLILLAVDGFAMEDVKGIARFTRPLWALASANLLVAALSMVQLLPSIELSLQSRRMQPIPFQEAMDWSLDPWSLVNLIFLDKGVDMKMGDGTQLFFGRNIPFFISYYFGAVFLFGFCFWLFYNSAKEKLVLGSLITVSLIFAFGTFTPIYPFLYQHIFFFRSFRFPEKWFFLTQAFLLFAVLRGLAGFAQADQRHAMKGLGVMAAVCSLLLVVYVVLRFNPVLLSEFILRHKAINLPLQFTVDNVASTLVSLERQLTLMVSLLLLFFLGKSGYLRQTLLNALLVVVVFVDLNWAHQGFQYLLSPREVLQSPKVLPAPDRDPDRLFYYPPGRNLHPSYFSILRPPTTPFNEIASIVASNLLPNVGVLFGFDYMQDINALGKRSYNVFLKFSNQLEPEKQFRLLGALNVKYVVSFRTLRAPGITLVRHFPEYPSWLYKINHVVPRVYVVDRAEVEDNPAKILEKLSGKAFDPLQQVLIDEPVAKLNRHHFEARANILKKYENQQVTIHASLNGPGILVLTDAYYPGWHVYVDGKEGKILKANYFFRGVALGEGNHLVEFKYEPRMFKIGLWGSILSFAALILFSILAILRGSKRMALDQISNFRNV